ncbi:MAG TPA: glutamate--cysteine ligase [Actinophytocola sp.]|uniref:carboxylate-amine ligase n=1 Tax=Actinophytocola sp. TaxID=1872138 RepID=UPI002DBBBAD8|nr:glutamate--cysteine ligase [Actinophytocola sp.]HEU5471283.1 glutamate--cysteine ligase [Actinophytocola sp.]
MTVGVEEEFFLTGNSGELVHVAEGTIATADEANAEGEGDAIDVKAELLRAQVESGSEICRDHRELRANLTDLRARLAEAAREQGARLLACGTILTDSTDPHRITVGRRFHRIVDHVGDFVVDGTTCGCHVHIGVDSPDIAMRVSNHLRPWLPVLLALSANSPFYRGADTGYASSRYLLWGRWPTSGPPPYLESVEHYERIVRGLLTSTAALDRGMIYWDIRPCEHQPTVEIRVHDTAATATEATLIGVLVRTLVAGALERIDHRVPAEKLPHEVLRANLWLAARDGLEGQCADPVTGELRPVHDILAELAARCPGGRAETDFAASTLAELRRTGGGAARQRAAYRRRHRWEDVVTMLVAQTHDTSPV